MYTSTPKRLWFIAPKGLQEIMEKHDSSRETTTLIPAKKTKLQPRLAFRIPIVEILNMATCRVNLATQKSGVFPLRIPRTGPWDIEKGIGTLKKPL